MTRDEFRQELERKLSQLQQELPQELGVAARTYFAGSFSKQGFGGDIWQSRRVEKAWPILIKTGQLESDVENADIDAGWPDTTITVRNEYAAYHNYGTSKLPVREFVGINEELEAELAGIIEKKITDLFK